MLQDKVTVYEILHIAPGERKEFELPSGKAVYSAKNTAYVQPKLHPRPDVERYMCEELGEDNGIWKVAITAVPKKGVKDDNEGSGTDS